MPFVNKTTAVKSARKAVQDTIIERATELETKATEVFQIRAYYSPRFSRPPYDTGNMASRSYCKFFSFGGIPVFSFRIDDVPYAQIVIKGLGNNRPYLPRNVPHEAARLFISELIRTLK